MAIVQVDVFVRNRGGVHGRPAMQVCDVASQFRCNIRLRAPRTVLVGTEPITDKSDLWDEADAKSVMQVIALALCTESRVVIHADGDDAEEAVAAMVAVFESGFNEE